jgi:hypothetical protein
MNNKMLAEALRNRADAIIDLQSVSDELFNNPLLNDAISALQVLARIVDGQTLAVAFNEPGYWGYKNPIGIALNASGQMEERK